MRVSFRLNPEYDYKLIKILQSYNNRNMSQLIRKILRDNLISNTMLSDNAFNTIDNNKKINKNETIKDKDKNELIEDAINTEIEYQDNANTINNESINKEKKKIKWNFPV